MNRRTVLCLVLVAACSEQPAPTAPVSPAPAPAAAAPPVAPTPPPVKAVVEHYVATVSSMKRAPNEAAKIDDAAGKKVSNWLATLYRGEVVRVLDEQGEWVRARASDDSEGWMKKSAVTPKGDLVLATVLAETESYERPGVVGTRKLPAGSLLFAGEVRDGVRKVMAPGVSAPLWVPGERLSSDTRELMVSRDLERVRWLKQHKKGEGIADILAAQERMSAGATLLAVLKEEVSGPADVEEELPGDVGVEEPE